MRDLTGRYRARGENSKTSGGVVGELTLTQAGATLTGSYRFWEERDTEPVSYNLPWEDCEVSGEVCNEQIVPRESEPSSEDGVPGGWDVVLRIGEQQLYGVLMTGGHIALSSRNNEFWYCEVLHREPGADA